MSEVNPPTLRQIEQEIDIRVRYQETDAQGRVHHATYINYFEIGRVELLRANGHSYREMERDGTFLVVAEVGCQYLGPAFYDDLLQVKTRVARSRGVRIRHEYEIRRDQELIATGFTVVASVDPDGNIKRLPEWLRM